MRNLVFLVLSMDLLEWPRLEEDEKKKRNNSKQLFAYNFQIRANNDWKKNNR